MQISYNNVMLDNHNKIGETKVLIKKKVFTKLLRNQLDNNVGAVPEWMSRSIVSILFFP